MRESTVLLTSDDAALVEVVGRIVRSIGDLRLVTLPRIDRAASFESWDDVDLVLIRQSGRKAMPEVAQLVRQAASRARPVASLVLGDPYEADQGLSLLRLGAVDYLGLPVDGPRLSFLVEALTTGARRPAVGPTGPGSGPAGPDDPLLDEDSAETTRLANEVRRAAPADASIVIDGEPGTGKSRLARRIHDLSPRRHGPFAVVDCSAGSAEAELFGKGRGEGVSGRFAEAARGSLLLDNVEDLSARAQVRLLRAVEARPSDEPIEPAPPLPRLIAAAAWPLEEAVADGRFRSDLYYRLNVIHLRLPPLRERRGAIGPMAARFAAEAAARGGPATISAEAVRELEGRDWPGNVRELREAIALAVARRGGAEVRPEDLPEPSRPAIAPIGPSNSSTLIANARGVADQVRGEVELARITQALEKHGNNRLRAAGELGISRMTLYKKLYKYGLMRHADEEPVAVGWTGRSRHRVCKG